MFNYLTERDYKAKPRLHRFSEPLLWFNSKQNQFTKEELINLKENEVNDDEDVEKNNEKIELSHLTEAALMERRMLFDKMRKAFNNHPFLELMKTLHYTKYEQSIAKTILMARGGLDKSYDFSYKLSFHLIMVMLSNEI